MKKALVLFIGLVLIGLLGCNRKVLVPFVDEGVIPFEEKSEVIKEAPGEDISFAAAVAADGEREKIESVVGYFELDSDELQPMSAALVDGFIEENRGKAFLFAGHACQLGTFAYNDDLSKRRAEFVYNTNEGAIDKEKSKITYMGEHYPVTNNPDEYYKNRRVQISILK